MFSNIIVVVFDILFYQYVDRHIVDLLDFLFQDQMAEQSPYAIESLYFRSLGDQMGDIAVVQAGDVRIDHIITDQPESFFLCLKIFA